ncbi:MAG TPA: hypothetical protein VFA74_02515 [Terriglobales bacterium]|nr:hypothetical protein [Terriglobales bacterium]
MQNKTHIDVFPRRQYSYSYGKDKFGANVSVSNKLQPEGIYRFIMGRDAIPKPLTLEQLDNGDAFAQLVLGAGKFPLNARELISILDESAQQNPEISEQQSFLVAEGGHIPWSAETADLSRQFRLVLTRGALGRDPMLFVSTSKELNSETTFLQVVSWDTKREMLQFYERRDGAWVWAGNSADALAPDSRGFGPFDSHVNGVLNMKELKFPWINWHSEAAAIQDTAFAPDDPFLCESVWKKRSQAEEMERIVRSGILRLTKSRFESCTVNGRLTKLPEFMRQVLQTTTVNLVSSPIFYENLQSGINVLLPLTFFMNSDVLIDKLGLDLKLSSKPTVDGALYAACLRRYDCALTDGKFRFSGDTHFVFAVPEPALEDNIVILELLERGILSNKMAACLLMVDFSNAIFSARRATFLQYIPDSAEIENPSNFTNIFVGRLETIESNLPANAPEKEFLANWRLPDNVWAFEFQTRLQRFLQEVRRRCGTLEEFAPIFELAESRRREFRRRPLAEFRLAIPTTNIPDSAPLLEFAPDASVRPKVM